jgi:DNA-binding NarL/FixJ family response regulator
VTVRVLVADDHPLVRSGVVGLLASAEDLEVVGEAADGREAIERAHQTSPDVILMDLSMPVLDGVEATRRVTAELPEVRVVVLTSFSDQSRVAAALSAGAVGYLLKDSQPGELLAAVRRAAEGHAPIDARVASALLPGRRAATLDDGLSPREREVLQLIGQGLANKQIARRLGITERTVKAHAGSVFRRIGVSDRTSAALWLRDHPG